jgi:hypothetical protein
MIDMGEGRTGLSAESVGAGLEQSASNPDIVKLRNFQLQRIRRRYLWLSLGLSLV